MGNKFDDAVMAWCNDTLKHHKRPQTALDLHFGYEIGCYSSWTCEYDVTATITFINGNGVEDTLTTDRIWEDVIRALPDYLEQENALRNDHDTYHDYE